MWGKYYLCIVTNQTKKMATIKLIVKSTEKGQPATIYLRFRDGREIDVIISTPEKVFPEYWNNKSQSFKQRIHFKEVFSEQDKVNIEEKFSQMKDFVLSEHFKLKGNPISKEWLKSVIDKFYEKKEPGAETLSQYIERFIDEATTGKRLNRGKRYTFSTIKNYKGFETQLNEYCGIYTEKRLSELIEKEQPLRPLKVLNFNDITIDFYNDFLAFCNEKDYSPNTTGRHIKHLKVIMRQAREEGLHNNTEYQRKSFEAMAVKVDNIYLTEAELKRLFDLDLSNNKPFELIRDVFLCGCYTAQRFGDYSRINKTHIRTLENDKKVIDLIQQKTGEKVVIPVRHELEIILSRYDYTLPKTFEQKVNEKIKIIGEMAKITEVVSYEESRGGLRVKKSMKKNQLIKTHTARRSGCTNMYLAGIPTIDIMKISGHKTEREFLKYIKVSKEETAVNLSNHPFFIGNVLSIAK